MIWQGLGGGSVVTEKIGSLSLFRGKVGVVVKALNEQRHVKLCLESALNAIDGLDGVVVLADSGSSDGTVEIASEMPVRVVQLANLSERCCGIGAQLGYQFVDVEYVYVLDGDMELSRDFLEKAIIFLDENPSVAGVAGLVEELGGGNYEFEARKAASDGRVVGEQESLDMGGLYRVSAIKDVGYLTNRNLHSYEEKELGLRLLSRGFRLVRLDIPSVRHHGKTEGSVVLLGRRWRSRHLDGPGEWVRATLGGSEFFDVLRRFKSIWIVLASWVLFLLSLALTANSMLWLTIPLAFQVVMLCALCIKRRSVVVGWMGYIHLHVYTAAAVRGLLGRQEDPSAWIAARVIK